MSERNVKSALDALNKARAEHDSVLVSFSGGKESCCVAELCVRTFPRCEFFFMYLVKGLDCVEAQLEFARKRWGVVIHQYPHWVLTKALRHQLYCNTGRRTLEQAMAGAGVRPAEGVEDDGEHYPLPEWKLKDVWALVRADTGIQLIATGQKAADNMARRRTLTNTKDKYLLHPLKNWNKFDVLSYLKAQGIPLPEQSGKQTNGIDLATPSLLWLHDRHPGDFNKLCQVFPFARAVVKRREFFGVGERFDGKTG